MSDNNLMTLSSNGSLSMEDWPIVEKIKTNKIKQGRPGGPQELSPEIQRLFFQLLSEGGLTLQGACAICELPFPTVTEWIRRGEGRHERPPTDEMVRFAEITNMAVEVGKAASIQKILEAGKGGFKYETVTKTDRNGNTFVTEKVTQPDWKANAWFLERKWPREWSKKEEVVHTGDKDKPITFVVEVPPKAKSIEEWERQNQILDIENRNKPELDTIIDVDGDIEGNQQEE